MSIDVKRQMLPMLDAPNQGARFFNPELPESTAVFEALKPFALGAG